MSVNKDLIETRIREINDAVQMLRSLTSKEFIQLNIYEKLSIRYLMIQLVEAASSICMHILLNVYNERAEGFPECFMRLGMKGVISKELADKLSSAARLRNLLVHRYWTIVDEKVYESVKDELVDFENFASNVRRFLTEDPVDEVEFKYYETSPEEKTKLIGLLSEKLKLIDDIVFAYVHGSFLERSIFRDVDVAIWIKSLEKAFDYTVNLSARLEVELGYPIDVHVLNEAPLPFKYHVFTRGKLLFSKDEELRTKIVDETLRKYLDLRVQHMFYYHQGL